MAEENEVLKLPGVIRSQRTIYDFDGCDNGSRLFLFQNQGFSSSFLQTKNSMETLDTKLAWDAAVFLHTLCWHVGRSSETKIKDPGFKMPSEDGVIRTPTYLLRQNLTLFGELHPKLSTCSVRVGLTYHAKFLSIRLDIPDVQQQLSQYEEWKVLVTDLVDAFWSNIAPMNAFMVLQSPARLSSEPWMYLCDVDDLYFGKLRSAVHPYLANTCYSSQIDRSWSYTPHISGDNNEDWINILFSEELIELAVQKHGKLHFLLFKRDEGRFLVGADEVDRQEWIDRLMLGLARLTKRPGIFLAHDCTQPIDNVDPLHRSEVYVKMIEKEVVNCSICMTRPKNRVWNCGHTYCQECSDGLRICAFCRVHKQFDLAMII